MQVVCNTAALPAKSVFPEIPGVATSPASTTNQKISQVVEVLRDTCCSKGLLFPSDAKKKAHFIIRLVSWSKLT